MAQLTRAGRVLGGRRSAIKLGEPPRNHATTAVQVVLYSLAVLFDVAKLFFVLLIVTGPALLGLAANVYVGGGTLGKIAAAGATATAGIVEVFVPGAASAVATFGAITAIMIGFAGWSIVVVIMLFSGIHLLGGRQHTFLRVLGGWIVSEIPFLGAIPTFTPTIFFILRDEKNAYRKALQKYKEQEQAQRIEQQQEYLARVQQLRMQQEMQAANDNEEEIEEEEAMAA